jgi:2-polyprenyl-3-methyl-5-hydroxy-6-metoxy-1,4-benzoquinol methylase/uncharacterized protein YbaR (Trm112 family)
MEIKEILNILKCPDCGTDLEDIAGILRCKNCGQSYNIEETIPILLPAEPEENKYGMDYLEHYKIDAEIFDYFAERDFPATEHDERRLREYIISEIPKKPLRILDVGSGGAWAARELSSTSEMFVSFDISQKNIKKSLQLNPNNNHFGVVGDALNLPFKKDVYDLIIASEIIEHIVEPREFISKLTCLLKSGGKLIVSTPYKEVLHYSQCIHCNRMTPKNAHLHSFDEKILNSLADPLITSKNNYKIFGNKALIMLRTHLLLKYLPFPLWKIIDTISNKIIRKPSHIIIIYTKK